MSLRKFDIPKVLIAQKITGFTIAKENYTFFLFLKNHLMRNAL